MGLCGHTVNYERLQGALETAGKPHEPHVLYEGVGVGTRATMAALAMCKGTEVCMVAARPAPSRTSSMGQGRAHMQGPPG